jgi:hypothetical protein
MVQSVESRPVNRLPLASRKLLPKRVSHRFAMLVELEGSQVVRVVNPLMPRREAMLMAKSHNQLSYLTGKHWAVVPVPCRYRPLAAKAAK